MKAFALWKNEAMWKHKVTFQGWFWGVILPRKLSCSLRGMQGRFNAANLMLNAVRPSMRATALWMEARSKTKLWVGSLGHLYPENPIPLK